MPEYYDVPMIKAPVWTAEISAYFFLGGLSAGAYVVGRMAERFGGGQAQALTSRAAWLAALSFVPCPPLLIADLGDPKRFHHMLRVFKPRSPMSLGTWILTFYSGALGVEFVRSTLLPRGSRLRRLLGPCDLAGLPLAVGMMGYTGVLLSTTANPLWCKNEWLGAVFSASAVHSAASALGGLSQRDPEPVQKALQSLDHLASAAEAVCLAGFIHKAGEKAAPLTRGAQAPLFWGGAVAAGLVAPLVLKKLPVPKKATLATAVAMAGALALRHAFLRGGRTSALDPSASRRNSGS